MNDFEKRESGKENDIQEILRENPQKIAAEAAQQIPAPEPAQQEQTAAGYFAQKQFYEEASHTMGTSCNMGSSYNMGPSCNIEAPCAEPKEEKRKGRDLWRSIKLTYQKLQKVKNAPEEFVEQERRQPIDRYLPDVEQGLTQAQVNQRIREGAVNLPPDPVSKSRREIIYSNVFTYFNLIFFIMAVLLLLVGSFRSLTFLPVVLANTLIGIFQELRSKKVLDNLKILNAPRSRVVRDGRERVIPADELVLDDMVIFSAGNQIPADAVVEEGEVLVNEALLTGESDQVSKKPGDTLLSGSYIVSGQCRARVDCVGGDSYVSQLTSEAREMNEEESSEMIRSLNRLVKIIGVLIIPIALLLFSQQYYRNNLGIRNSITGTVAAIIGMIPEGLYLLATVALAVSAMRLASQKVLVRNMKCIETLARTDILCIDKTGTITDNTMIVKKLLLLRPELCPQADPASPSGTDASASDAQDAEMKALEDLTDLELAIGDFAAAMATDNITIKAIKDHFRKRSGKRPEQVYPFSSVTKYSGAVFEDISYVMGAPEFVLMDDYPQYAGAIEPWSRQGYRVLVFGAYPDRLDGKKLKRGVTPMGMILLSNPVRANARETFRFFANQGVRIKVISGDSPLTVSEIAQEAEIEDAQNYIDASTLKTEEQLRIAAERYTVFGRVSPEQKREMVGILQEMGHTVAMTGDGVNDVLALKRADCSIAMASGSDAASQVAHLVLLESEFSKMPAVVAEGRRVVNNIERTASLFLVKNIFSLCLAVLSIILMINYPLEPTQISLISMFTIGIPAFFLSLERNTNRIRGRFFSNVFLRALPGGLTDFIVVSALYLFCLEFNVNRDEVSTLSTIVLAVVGMMILYQVASPMTRFHWILWFCMAGGIIYCLFFAQRIFAISSISHQSVMLLVIFTILVEPVLRYLNRLVKWASEKYRQRRKL